MGTSSKDLLEFLERVNLRLVESEDQLAFRDPFVTSEQKKRDAQVTKLLTAYVKSYEGKTSHSVICRYILLSICALVIIAFSIMLICFAVMIMRMQDTIRTNNIIAFITACVSFVSLIIGLLTIITKYFFPEDDEKYITQIVELIQKNDLENKRENAKHDTASHCKSEE